MDTDFSPGFRMISGDPSISRIEQYILRLLELLESQFSRGNITKSNESNEILTLAKNIKKEFEKNKNNTGMTLKGKDFLRGR